MVVEKSCEQFRINGSVKLSAQKVSLSLESTNVSCDYIEIVPHATRRRVTRSMKNSPSRARKMSIRNVCDCEKKDRFRSRDLQFETISGTIESRKKKRGGLPERLISKRLL